MSASTQPTREDPLKGFVIPPMPESLQAIEAERAREEPDVSRIGNVIAGDVSLAAEVLKTVNSPYFGLSRPLSSVPNAVTMLGLNNVLNVANAVGLRAAMRGAGGPLSMERFWDTAGDVAVATAALAKELSGIPRDVGYSLGLFHDCGIPLMAQRFPDHLEVLREAGRNGGGEITRIETEHFRVNHAEVGYHIARAWNLPEEIALAIRYHHRYAELAAPGNDLPPNVITLVSLLKLAEHISDTFRAAAFRPLEESHEWETLREAVLAHLELADDEFEDLKCKLLLTLGQR